MGTADPKVATHDTFAALYEARRQARAEILAADVRDTAAGRFIAANREKLGRIGSQISELLRAEYDLDSQAIQTNDLAARRALRERSHKVRELRLGLEGDRSNLIPVDFPRSAKQVAREQERTGLRALFDRLLGELP